MFEKLSSSDSKRRAFNFVRQRYNLTTLAREARDTVKSKELKALAAPLMDALGKRDAEFFKGLAEAMRILEQREISSKTKYPGNLDKWLLEYQWKTAGRFRSLRANSKNKSSQNSGASRLINCGENANVLAFSLSRMREARQLRDTGSLPGTKPICDPHPDKKVVFCEIR